MTAPLFIWRSRLESGAVSVFARCWRCISLRFQRPQANVLSNGRLGVRPGPGYSEASCSGRGSWRATTSPRLSQRVMDGCGSLATMARNSLRAIARRRSATVETNYVHHARPTRMTRHRERRRQGTRCITVDVSQSERDALVVRGYLPEEERENGAAVKKGIEAVLSDIGLDLQYETAERSRTRG